MEDGRDITEPPGAIVLMVDDDALMRSTVRRILRRHRVEVTCAEDGIQAMRLLHGGLMPGLILLDIDMPRLNGWQVLEQLKKDPRLAPIPVVVVSGAMPVGDFPVARFLAKPFRLSELLALLHEYCGIG